MLAIELPEEIENRLLTALAQETGRTKAFYVCEAILEDLDDLEDIYLAEKRLERVRKRRALAKIYITNPNIYGCYGNLFGSGLSRLGSQKTI